MGVGSWRCVVSLTFPQHVSQRQQPLWNQDVLQLVPQVLADTKTVHWGETNKPQTLPPAKLCCRTMILAVGCPRFFLRLLANRSWRAYVLVP